MMRMKINHDDAVIYDDDNDDVDNIVLDVDGQSNGQFIILYDTKSGLFRRMWLKRRLF